MEAFFSSSLESIGSTKPESKIKDCMQRELHTYEDVARVPCSFMLRSIYRYAKPVTHEKIIYRANIYVFIYDASMSKYNLLYCPHMSHIIPFVLFVRYNWRNATQAANFQYRFPSHPIN